MMRGYADTDHCRRQFLLGYFGDSQDDLCGVCDNCLSGRAAPSTREDRFGTQTRVRHAEFGDGVVMDTEDDVVTVLFESVGYRTLHLPTVLAGSLLERLPA